MRINAPEPVPADAIRVDRGTPWGNPYSIRKDQAPGSTLEAFSAYATCRMQADPQWLEPIRGHHLACWCHPNPCHADILVKLANA